MSKLLAVLTGFLVGGAAVIGLVIALPENSSAGSAAHRTAAMPMRSGMGGMGSGMMNTTTALAVRTLTIQHVQRGCHVWSDGKTTGPMMRLHLKRGQMLRIMDMDVDAHQMMQFSGPMRLMMGGPMMMNRGMTFTFTKTGVYRLGTHTVDMPGGMDVKTIGPDNKLRLVVTVT
jgi:hypothetical protein